MWKVTGLTAAIVCALGLLAEGTLRGHDCPPGANLVGASLSGAAGYSVRDPGPSLNPIGFNGIGPCEKIKIGGHLAYLPSFGGNIGAAFSGGRVIISTLNGTFSQDVTPPGGVPLIGPLPSTCTPPAVTDGLRFLSSELDIGALQADIDANGNIIFMVSYSGGVAHVGNHIAAVAATVAFPVHVLQGLACNTPWVLVNGLYSPSNYFRIPATNAISVAIMSSFSPADIRFTLDGSQPAPGSSHYSQPFAVSNRVTVRAAAYDAPDYSIEQLSEPVVIEVVPVYSLMLGTPGGGSVSANPPGGQYLSNAVVTLTASPAAGWAFLRWQDSSGSTNPVLAVTMDRARSAQAVFGTFITSTAQGPGSVSNDPAQGPYPFGSTVRLSAIPDPGSYFLDWTGAAADQMVSPLDFVVTNASPTLLARFDKLRNGTSALTVLVNGAGNVTKSPQLSNYRDGAEVTLTALPAAGADFRVWSGDVSGSNPVLSVTMDSSKTIVANFTSGANLPPTVALINPSDGSTIVAPASVTVSATASDPDTNGSVVRVDLYDGATLLGRKTNAPFDFTWVAPTAATHALKAVATDNGGLSATSAPVMVAVQAVPTFHFSTANYSVTEGATSVALVVLKNPDSGQACLKYDTADGSAKSTGVFPDYNPVAKGSLCFGMNELSKTITIQIRDDQVVESDQFFTVTLTAETGLILTEPSVATVTIVDNDLGSTNSITQPVPPGEPESPLGSLQVNLLQHSTAQAPGQWRFTWELDWRDGGTVASNLPGGNYEIEFKPVNGYAEPLRTPLAVPAGANQVETFYYTNWGAAQVGSLKVTLLPGSLGPAAAWKRVGEASYHASDETVDSLPVGSYTLEFTNTTGQWVSPGRRLVTVDANRLKEITAQYLVGPLAVALLPSPVDFAQVTPFGPNRPYTFCGQILSDAGWGSGWVAKERVVLTAAHVVYDDRQFSFQPIGRVKWFFQRHVGVYEPPPKLPRGWCVFTSYSARRIADGTPGYSSLAAQDLDVAALYFYEPAARRSGPGVLGGYGGYLVSRPGTEWLFGPGVKTLAGYPVEGKDATGTPVVPGGTYATSLGLPNFTVRSNGVYSTLDIQGLPGMSGGPLCVQWTNDGFFFPAAIYLGGSQETLVRLIDADVVGLINCAETMGDAGQDHLGGGPLRLSSGQSQPVSYYGFVTVHLLPPAVTNLGAGYRFQNPVTLEPSDDDYNQQTNLFAFLGNNPSATTLAGWNLEFKAIPGYIAPPDRFIAVLSGQRTNIFANYQAYGALQAMPATNAVRLLGSSGSLYRVEYATRLLGTAGASSAWAPMTTQRLNDSSTVLTNLLQAGPTNAFLRAVLLP